MASVGDRSFVKTVDLGSDESFDFSCTRCERRGKHIEAGHYCQDCDEFYCNDCVQIHSEISALKQHYILDKTSKTNWGKPRKTGTVGPECDEHRGQIISLFCPQHDVVCCPVCVSLEHRQCQGMDYIPQIAKGIFQSNELRTLRDDLDTSVSQLEQLKGHREDMKNNLDKSSQKVSDKLSDFRKKVNMLLDALEKKAFDEMKKIRKMKEDAIQAEINKCEDILNSIRKHQELCEATCIMSEPQMFIRMQEVKKQIQKDKDMINTLCHTTPSDHFTFDVDPDLENFFEIIPSLGVFDKPLDESHFQHAYTVDTKKQYSINLKKDKRQCCIESMCQMSNGHILLVDSSNSNLKRLDTSYNIVDHCVLPSYPYDIACTVPGEVALGLHNNSIQFVSVGMKMVTIRSRQLDHQCCTLGYHDGKLYVAEFLKKTLYVYSSSSCTLLQTICKDTLGKKIFSSIQKVRLSKDGARIYVSDINKGLVTVDNKGHVLSTVILPGVDGLSDMCTDRHDNVFIAGKKSDNVIQIGNKGTKTIGVVLSMSDGVKAPVSVWFDSLQSKLLVFNNQANENNILLAFKLS